MRGGVTVRIKHSVKLRVIRELEGYPSVINEMKPEVITGMLVTYMERMVEKGKHGETREIAEKIKEIEVLHNCLEGEEASEVGKSYYMAAGVSYHKLKEYVKAYKCIRYITSPKELENWALLGCILSKEEDSAIYRSYFKRLLQKPD